LKTKVVGVLKVFTEDLVAQPSTSNKGLCFMTFLDEGTLREIWRYTFRTNNIFWKAENNIKYLY